MPGVTVQYSTFTLQSFTTSSDATWATYICLCRHTKWWKGTPSTPRIISSWRYKKFIHGLNHLQYSSPTLVALIRTLQPKNCATLLDELYLSLPMQNRTRYIHNRVAHTMCKNSCSFTVYSYDSVSRRWDAITSRIPEAGATRNRMPRSAPPFRPGTIKLSTFALFFCVESSFLSTSSTWCTSWFAMKTKTMALLGTFIWPTLSFNLASCG